MVLLLDLFCKQPVAASHVSQRQHTYSKGTSMERIARWTLGRSISLSIEGRCCFCSVPKLEKRFGGKPRLVVCAKAWHLLLRAPVASTAVGQSRHKQTNGQSSQGPKAKSDPLPHVPDPASWRPPRWSRWVGYLPEVSMSQETPGRHLSPSPVDLLSRNPRHVAHPVTHRGTARWFASAHPAPSPQRSAALHLSGEQQRTSKLLDVTNTRERLAPCRICQNMSPPKWLSQETRNSDLKLKRPVQRQTTVHAFHGLQLCVLTRRTICDSVVCVCV